MTRIRDRGIFQQPNGMWWGNSPSKPGYASSLHTRDRAKAQAKYDDMLARMRQGEREVAEYDRTRKGK